MYAIKPADLGTVPTSLQRRRQGRSAAVEGVTRRLTPGQHLFYESDRANFVFKVTSGGRAAGAAPEIATIVSRPGVRPV